MYMRHQQDRCHTVTFKTRTTRVGNMMNKVKREKAGTRSSLLSITRSIPRALLRELRISELRGTMTWTTKCLCVLLTWTSCMLR